MTAPLKFLTSRREFLFAYDIKMGNPNGDPDENRPRVLPDRTHYVTDVRLKRFVRDYLKAQGQEILVDTIAGRTTNLTGRVAAYLKATNQQRCEGAALVNILLEAFVDARLFGSSLAFKKLDGWEPTAEPKTLTGAVQIRHGEIKHQAQEVDINGLSVLGSTEEKRQGTFTTSCVLRYGLIVFNGIANQHSAQLSRMTDADYDTLLQAMWYGVRSAGNTRSKRGQVPRLLLSVVYKPGEEFQFGNLTDYLQLQPTTNKPEIEWSSPEDYLIDLGLLIKRLKSQAPRIAQIDYCLSPDVKVLPSLLHVGLPLHDLQLDEPRAG